MGTVDKIREALNLLRSIEKEYLSPDLRLRTEEAIVQVWRLLDSAKNELG